MKRPLLVLLVLASLLSACGPGGAAPTGPAGSPCGDSICSGPENSANCPQDCPSAALGTGPSTPSGPGPAGRAPLFMTTMTHMEHGFDDDINRNVFLLHIEQLTYGMDLADEYGAVLTVESEQPFAIANVTWNRNFMAEILARGHGVGTHCDFGFRDEVMPVERYSRSFAENKALVDDLVGPENNLGCSGGGGANDWAIAASLAGFKYLDGIVGMHYLAMPLENRPAPSWTDDFIYNEGYHRNTPVDLYQRIYPFMVADATDFAPDENGVILVSSGELGALALMAEGTAETGGSCRDCPLTTEDVDALVRLIREVDRNRDPARVAKLTVYIPVSDFVPENEAVLRYFFEQVRILEQEGLIAWATQLQVYQAYLQWNP